MAMKKEQTLAAHSSLRTFVRATQKRLVCCVLCESAPCVCVPVIVSVDSPDHSNGDANSCQDERAHREGVRSDREPRETKTRGLKYAGLGGTEALLPGRVGRGKLNTELRFPQ